MRKYDSLLMDFYELTMSDAFSDLPAQDGLTYLFFRKNPYQEDGQYGYTIACGMETLVDFIKNFRFEKDDVDYLSSLKGVKGDSKLSKQFRESLLDFRFQGDIDAVPEGTVVFAHEPFMSVKAPLMEACILEGASINLNGFQSLIATKASRVCTAAKGAEVLEFGFRRAQGFGDAVLASRAAYIGGVAGTSLVQAGKEYGVPVRGTHAHLYVNAFDSEIEAFRHYAKKYPNDAVLLIDTYDTIQGAHHAVEVARELRAKGHELLGVRIDSGDLAKLSREVRDILDEAGFPKVKIVASSDLDEKVIASLIEQGAKIDVYGVGTRLVTSYDQPALNMVYKLSGLRREQGDWMHKMKLSNNPAKASLPGDLRVRRFELNGRFVGDMIYDAFTEIKDDRLIINPLNQFDVTDIPVEAVGHELLVPMMRKGKIVYPKPSIHEIRERAKEQLSKLNPDVVRIFNAGRYPVGLEPGIYGLRTSLIMGSQLRERGRGAERLNTIFPGVFQASQANGATQELLRR